MASNEHAGEDFVAVAELAIEAVRPSAAGFELTGRGRDRAEYRMELHLELPVDRRTQTVLGELLAQSEWRVWRRAPRPRGVERTSRRRKPVR